MVHLKTIVRVEIWVGQIREFCDSVLVKSANFRIGIVEHQDAKISQQLAFLNVFELSAADSSIEEVVLDGTTVVSDC